MLTIDDDNYVEALKAHAGLNGIVDFSGKGLNFTLESKERTKAMMNNIKKAVHRLEEVLIENEFLDKE